MWMLVFVFMILGSFMTSAQSNMQCEIYPSASVPGDMVSLFKQAYQNNSHAQLLSQSGYDYTVACNSSLYQLDTGCSGTYTDVLQLNQANNSHISVDNMYSNNLCFNASGTYASFFTNVSLTGATPADYECVFGFHDYNDSHVYMCDADNATYNFNIKVNSSYSGCVDLDDELTYQGKVVNNSNHFGVSEDIELCQKTYEYGDGSNQGIIYLSQTGITIDCAGATLLGNDSGYGVNIHTDDAVTLKNCNISNYSTGIRVDSSDDVILFNNTLSDNDAYGINLVNHAYRTNISNNTLTINQNAIVVGQFSDGTVIEGNTVQNSGNRGVYLSSLSILVRDNSIHTHLSGGAMGVYLSTGSSANISGNTIYNNTWGVFISADNTNITNNNIYNNTYGINLKGSQSNLISNNNFNTIGSSAIKFESGSTDNLVILNDMEGSSGLTDACINVTGSSQNNNFTNNTFTECGHGVFLTGSLTSGNYFYYNLFVDSLISQATLEAGTGTNYFNTTNGTACAECGRGNQWSDIRTNGLDIIDFVFDGFGDSGTEYPYNSTAGNVSDGVVDWGPLLEQLYSPVMIIRPTANTILSGNHLVEVHAPDNIVKVMMYLSNATGSYALNGSAGQTNDTYSDDGWIEYINTTAFASGTYDLHAVAYESGGNDAATDTETNLTIDNEIPTGSVVIYGSNGTAATPTQNVNLNLTYSSDAAYCRYANDVASSITSAEWENCVLNKAWLLSSGYGNKTVYVQYKDAAGNNITVNDSIIYTASALDNTPPTLPVVYDGATGTDVDWWNLNLSYAGYWWNSTDDLATVKYYYRILENDTTNITPYVDVGTSQEANVTGLELNECYNYSFEVIAYSDFGGNASSAYSNGSTLDMTLPGNVSIDSSTHPNQGTTYSNGTIWFNWSATDSSPCGQASGIEGYSYILDQTSNTEPDNNLEGYTRRVIQSMPATESSGFGKRSGAGIINVAYSQGTGNLTVGDTVRVGIKLFENTSETTEKLGYYVYVVSKPLDSGAGAFSIDETSDAISNIAYELRDIRHELVPGDSDIYYTDVVINQTLTNEEWYVALMPDINDDDNTNEYGSAGTFTADNSTKLFNCLEGIGCGENSNAEVGMTYEVISGESRVSYQRTDGTYYFHIKAKDKAGNWGNTSHYRVNIDTIGADVKITSPITGQITSNPNLTVTVEVDETANVTVYAFYDGGNSSSTSQEFNGTSTFNITLGNGTNRIYAVANHSQSHVITTSPNVYVRLGTTLDEANKTLRIQYGGGSLAQTYFTYNDQGGYYVGAGTEKPYSPVTATEVIADTSDGTIKIFLTDDFDTSEIDAELGADEFLDQKIPLFGFDKKESKENVVRTRVRYPRAYFDGTRRIGTGAYTIVFTNNGLTSEGLTNISVKII